MHLGHAGRDALPLVSIVTPSLNQGRFIVQTIESVRSQDYPRIEHIIVDGGSTDETLDVLRRSSDLRWISEPDDGQTDAINKGFAMASGEIFAWLNADDLYLAGAVSTAVAALRETGAGLVYGGHLDLDEDGQVLRERPARAFDFRKLLDEKNFISQPASFFTREAFEAVSGLDVRYHYAMDYDLWVRVASRFELRAIDRTLAGFRLHDTTKTSTNPDAFFPEVHRSSRAAGGRYFSRLYLNYMPTRHPHLFKAVVAWRRLRVLRFRARRRLGLRQKVRVDGFRLMLDPRDELGEGLMADEYERPERELVRRVLRAGDVFADIGAHVGLFSVLAARCVGRSGRVYAFEPSSRTFDALRGNVRRNRVRGIVVTRRVALSDADGRASIQIGGGGFSAWTSFGRRPPGESATVEEVETRTVDSLVADGSMMRPFFLKLDVEGWELHVLNGGVETFSAPDAPHLIVEFTDWAQDAVGSSTRELYEALTGLGYGLFRYVAGNLVDEPCREEYPYDNIIATKRPDELRDRLRQCRD